MVIVGGSGYFFGPFVGALISVLLPEWMRITEGYYLIIYALFVMVLMMFCPSGVIGFFERVQNMVRRRTTSSLVEAQAP
jgi:branched-chain amino acid transport system permease protein